MMKKMAIMQNKMKDLKNETEALITSGSSGAGLVEITINGAYKVQSIKIDDNLLTPENKSMISSLVAAAFNSATDKMKEAIEAHTAERVQELLQ